MFKKISDETLVVVPAYNANKTIVKVIDQIGLNGFKNIIVSDDCSNISISKIIFESNYPVIFIEQNKNLGYGGNQKYLYNYAIKKGFNYVIMIHGDL